MSCKKWWLGVSTDGSEVKTESNEVKTESNEVENEYQLSQIHI